MPNTNDTTQEFIIHNNIILNHKSDLEQIIKYALEKYYLIPYPNSLLVNGLFRPLHGADHAVRTAVLIDFLVTFFHRYYPEGLVKPDGSDMDIIDLNLTRLAAIYHDSANTSESFHDEEKHADNFRNDMNKLGFPIDKIEIIAWSMANKDASGEKNVFQRLIHDADCLEYLRILIARAMESELKLSNMHNIQCKYFKFFNEELLDVKKILNKNISADWHGLATNTLNEIILSHKMLLVMVWKPQSRIDFQKVEEPYLGYRITASRIYKKMKAERYSNALENKTVLDNSLNPAEKLFQFCDLKNFLSLLSKSEYSGNEIDKNEQHSALMTKFRDGETLIRRLWPAGSTSKISAELAEIAANQKFRPATLVIEGIPIATYKYPDEWSGVIVDATKAQIDHTYKENADTNEIIKPNFNFSRTLNRCKDLNTLASLRAKIHEINKRRRGEVIDSYLIHYGNNIIPRNEVLMKYRTADVIGILVGSSAASAMDALSLYFHIKNSTINFYYYSPFIGLYRISLDEVIVLAGANLKGVVRPETQQALENKHLHSFKTKLDETYLDEMLKSNGIYSITLDSYTPVIFSFGYETKNHASVDYECQLGKDDHFVVKNTETNETYLDNTGFTKIIVSNYLKDQLSKLQRRYYNLTDYILSKYKILGLGFRLIDTSRRGLEKCFLELEFSYDGHNLSSDLNDLYQIDVEEKCLQEIGKASPPNYKWQIRNPLLIGNMVSELKGLKYEIYNLADQYQLNPHAVQDTSPWFVLPHLRKKRLQLLKDATENPSRAENIFKQFLSEDALDYCGILLNSFPELVTREVKFTDNHLLTALFNSQTRLIEKILHNIDWISFWIKHEAFMDEQINKVGIKSIIFDFLNNSNISLLRLIDLMKTGPQSVLMTIVSLLTVGSFQSIISPDEKNTLLHLAVELKNYEFIKRYVMPYSFIKKNANGITPLYLALNDEVAFKLFIEAVEKWDITKVITIITFMGEDKLFVEAKALLNSQNFKKCLHNIPLTKKMFLGEDLLKHNAPTIVDLVFADENNLLVNIETAIYSNLTLMRTYFKYLIQTSSDNFNEYDISNTKNVQVAKFLLRNLVDSRKQNFELYLVSQCIAAIQSRDFQKAKLIYNTGVNMYKKDELNRTAFGIALTEMEVYSELVDELLGECSAQWQGTLHHIAVRSYFLDDPDFISPLERVARRENIDMERLFVDPYGNIYEGTALHAAIIWGRAKSVELLLRYSPNLHIPIRPENKEWRGCIELSYELGYFNITKLLIKALVKEHYHRGIIKNITCKYTFFSQSKFSVKNFIASLKLENTASVYGNFWVSFNNSFQFSPYNLHLNEAKAVFDIVDSLICELTAKMTHSSEAVVSAINNLVQQLKLYRECTTQLFCGEKAKSEVTECSEKLMGLSV